MLALQASIGALNDLADAAADAGRKLAKPIPAGLVSRRMASGVALGGLVAGVTLSAPSGVPTLLVAVAGVTLGYVYDLRLSRSGWSWLPLALALPLLPVHAWLGATGTVPWSVVALVPIGMLAGAALAIANALADLERDREAGSGTVVVLLGPTAARRVGAALCLGTLVVAAALFPGGATTGIPLAPALAAGGGAAILAGTAVGWRGGAGRRQRAWELQAVGTALLGIGWIAAAALVPHAG